ncbi:MAG: hypothetical protein Kow0081_0590 [Candidatus Dojkabacteria bacterium]
MSNKYIEHSKSKKARGRFILWLNQASYDVKAAKLSLDNNFYEWSCYQSIQSVEKALKAVLVHAGFRPPRTHKLGVLISMANRANKSFLGVKFQYRKIESYTFVSRYPFVLPNVDKPPHELIDQKDAETCIQIAEDIHNKVTNFLRNRKPEKPEIYDLGNYYYTEEEVQKRIDDVVLKILECEEMEVNKIILFGSFARERVRPRDSTMDILIVANTDLNFIERIQKVRDATKGAEPIIEPLIYTPEEFKLMVEEEGEGFLESAIEEGEILFPREV